MARFSDELPRTLWFGKVSGQWPIQCWESEVHARNWYQSEDEEHRTKYIWKAELQSVVEYTVVSPEPYLEPVSVGPSDGSETAVPRG